MTDERVADAPAKRHAVPRWLWVVGGVVVVLLGCEVAGWPFLVGPVERQASKALGRDVTFSPSGGPEHPSTKIHLLGRLRLDADALQVAAPSWSKDPYFIDAKVISLALPYSAIWQATHGEKLHIIRLHADELNVFAERDKERRTSWELASAKQDDANKEKAGIPRFDSLVVREGRVVYRDAPLDLDLDSRIHTMEGDRASSGSVASSSSSPERGSSSPAAAGRAPSTAMSDADKDAQGLVVTTTGHYRKGTFDGRLTASGALPLLGGAVEPVPMIINFRSGDTSFNFTGQAANALALDGITGEFRFKGPSLGDISDLVTVTLPTTPAFDLVGKVRQQGQLWDVLVDNAKIGASTLQAQMQYDARGKKPILAGKLVGQKVQLVDLAPSIGGELHDADAKPKEKTDDGRALPDREFDLPSLRMMDADVSVNVEDLELGRVFAQPLRPLRAHLTLKDGVLKLSDILAQTAGGRLQGLVSLDGNGKLAKWNTDLRWSDVELAQWFKQKRADGAPPFITGKLNGQAKLTGEGKSTSSILGTLHGTMGTSLREGSISHLIVEAAGIDIAQALGVFIKGDNSLPVTCGVADFRADKGVLFPRAFLLDTTDSTVIVTGNVSLASERLDLKAQVDPKDKTPLALRAPILVKGTFEDPKVSLEASKLAPRAVAAGLLALINPIAAVLPLIDLGDGQKVSGCETFLERKRQEGAGGGTKGNGA